jgi:hypothetical protein
MAQKSQSPTITKKGLLKENKKVTKERARLKARLDKQAAAKKAQRQPSRVTVARQELNKRRDKFTALPLILQALVLLMAYRWIKDTQEKAEAERDLADAVTFLRESRGFRA